jgi:hypothetical protein
LRNQSGHPDDLPDGRYEGAIDALAVKYGSGASATRKALMTTRGYQLFDRVSVTFPLTLYERIDVGYTSASGSVVAMEINKATGAVVILDEVTVLECGRATNEAPRYRRMYPLTLDGLDAATREL